MVGHLITLIIDAQQVIHAIRCQFLNDGVGLLTDRDVHHLRHGSVVVHALSIEGLGVLWRFGGQSEKWHKAVGLGSAGLYNTVTSEGGAGSP